MGTKVTSKGFPANVSPPEIVIAAGNPATFSNIEKGRSASGRRLKCRRPQMNERPRIDFSKSGEIGNRSFLDATAIESFTPYMLSVLRIVAALLFLEHGLEKLIGFPAPGPAMTPLVWVQGGIETIGGLLLLFGAFTRPVAFILSGNMAVAYFMAHFPKSFFPAVNGGDAAVLYCFVFLFIFFLGGGPWSLDEILFKRASHREDEPSLGPPKGS
jgi:putative oxidoreductase